MWVLAGSARTVARSFLRERLACVLLGDIASVKKASSGFSMAVRLVMPGLSLNKMLIVVMRIVPTFELRMRWFTALAVSARDDAPTGTPWIRSPEPVCGVLSPGAVKIPGVRRRRYGRGSR